MKYLNVWLVFVLIIIQSNSFSQTNYDSICGICNSFDSNIVLIKIDSNGIWDIGKPNKSGFDSSYSGLNSIVTDLDSLYPNNDTSIFYASYSFNGSLPDYLGTFSILEIKMMHQFNTDSISDYGTIEMSFDDGDKWYDVLSNTHNNTWGYNDTYHYFLGSNDTVYDSLLVTGNSNGWVYSKFSKDINPIIYSDSNFGVDSVLLKFSLITDSIGRNEGWQIDNLCIKMNCLLSIEENNKENQINITPNPAQETIRIQFLDPNIRASQELKVYSITGQLVFQQMIHPPESEVNIETLESGVYMYEIGDDRGKIVVE